jgi:TrmH family RNA methyltransferase
MGSPIFFCGIILLGDCMITSVQNKEIKDVIKLKQKKYRDKAKLFILEGEKAYLEALEHNIVKTVYTTLSSFNGEAVVVSEHVMDKLVSYTSNQTIVSVCHFIEEKPITGNALILHKLQDPGNMGALLRSASAFGIKNIILSHTVDLYNGKVLRSAQGFLFSLNVVKQDLPSFKAQNSHSIVFLDVTGERIKDVSLTSPFALVVGNEGHGFDIDDYQLMDQKVTIPTHIESLNVAVAGSIIMYELSKT